MTQPSERQRWLAFLVAALVAGVVLLDIGKVNLALPSIEASLDASPTALQLISPAYVVAFGLVLIPFGRLGDRGHRRSLVLIGLVVFALASLVAGFAGSAEVIVVGRVLQGIAAGIMMPQSIGLIQQLFTGAERGKAFGAYGIVTACSTAFGPTLGGLLVTLGGTVGGWRWIFLMNVPGAVVLFILGWQVLPRVQPSRSVARGFDLVGTVLLGLAITALLAPIVLTTGRPTDDPRRWWLLVVAAAFAWGFAAWERAYAARGGSPLIDASLMRTPSFRLALTVAATWLACGPGAQLALVLFLQLGLGYNPFESVLMTLPGAAGSAVGSWWAARRILTHGRRITIAGLTIALAAGVATVVAATTLPLTAIPVAIGAAALVQGLGGGMVLSPNHVLLLEDVPTDKGSLAASIGHLAQRIGNSVGVAVAAAAFFATIFAQSGGLAGADAQTYERALVYAYSAASVFLVLALVVVGVDHRRRLRLARLGVSLNDDAPVEDAVSVTATPVTPIASNARV